MVLIAGKCQHGSFGIDCIECYRLALADAQDEIKAMNPVVEAATNHVCPVAPWFRLQRCAICKAVDAYQKTKAGKP